jgi:hypothetical protein
MYRNPPKKEVILGYDGGEYEDNSLLEYGAVQSR